MNERADSAQGQGSARPTPMRDQESAAFRSCRIVVWLAGFLLICFGYFGPHNDSNQKARIDMAVAIVDNATFNIDPYQLNTVDKDLVDGHYFSNKAPASSFVAVPVYLLYKAYFSLRGGMPAVPVDDAQLWYLEAFTLVALPSVLFLLLFFWFLGYFSSSHYNRALLTLAFGIGTMIFPYSQNYFSHVTVAGLLFAAFVCIYIGGGPDTVRGAWSRRLADNPTTAAYLAGVALGTAVLFEYPPAVIALVIAVYAFAHLPRKTFLSLILGAAPPLFALLAYNYLVFHNPFTLSYASGSDVTNSAGFRHGVAGFGVPSPSAWWGMSFSPFRGLFFLSPFLLLAIPGFALWRRRGGQAWLVCLAISVGFFVVISMFLDWSAGFSVGSRYLIPMLPFLAVPAIFTLDYIDSIKAPREILGAIYGLVYLLIFVSIVDVWAETIPLTGLYWPTFLNPNPLFTWALPSLFTGAIIPNQGTMLFRLTGMESLALLAILLVLWSIVLLALPAPERVVRRFEMLKSREGAVETA